MAHGNYSLVPAFVIFADNPFVAEGIYVTLKLFALRCLQKQVANRDELLQLVVEKSPDLIILGNLEDSETVKKVRQLNQNAAIIAATANSASKLFHPTTVIGTFSHNDPKSLERAIARFIESLKGGVCKVKKDYNSVEVFRENKLSEIESFTLLKFCQGFSCEQIATLRSVKPITVANTLKAIKNKLHLPSKESLIVAAFRSGFVSQNEGLSGDAK